MASLLRQANQALTRGEAPDGVARQFYADLAKLGLKAPMVELNRLKTRLTEVGLETTALGEKLGGGGTPVERALLVYRRDLTMDSIRAAVAEVARTHGTDVGSVYLAKIGKWAVQNPDMFTLAGDIDFSFMGARPDVLIALRDAFNRIITERSGGLDMVAIDSVATAHGFAEHMVYMGIQGRKFADDAMMGMNEGVEQIDFRDPDSVGTKRGRQLSGRQALIETVLEETGIRYREEGHEAKGRRLSDEVERTWSERRNQTVEPFLSMEMARHLEADIIRNVDVFAAIDIIKKGAKYLRRSNDQTTGDLKIPAADAGWAKLVVEVDEKAKKATAEEMVKFIDAELGKLGIEGFEMKIVDGKATLQTKPGGAEAFLAQAKQMIWSNVSNGLDARITGLTDALNNRGRAAGPETPDDLRPERLADTVRMIEAGLDVMKHEHSDIPPDVKTKLSVLAKLIEGYAAPRGYALPKEELDKLRELLKDAAGNENTLLLKMGAVVGHIDKWLVKNYDAMTAKLPAPRQLAYADAQIDALNSVMDVLDNSTLGALRDRGIVELELDPILSADGKSRRLAAVTFPRIAAINQRLNQSILGRIGNNTAFKTFNLYQEGDAYYAALMQANTPSEAFGNIATEIFRRRVPGGGAVEAIVMENYLRASIEVVYTIFPPIAIPEGLYGIGVSLYESGKQAWWRSELEFLIDSLYDKARFEAAEGKPGTFRLKEVTYKRTFSRDDLEKGRDFILDPAVDQTLTKNLRAGDAFLTLMEELQNHGAAGDKVRASFKAKADKRWEELKHEFVLHLIDKLEKRYAAEIADVAGKIPDLFNELMDAAEKLEIKDQVLASMEATWGSYSVKFRDYWVWLKNTARAGIWGGTLAETERNRAAREVMRYRDAYKSVLENREKLEAAVAQYLAQAGLDGPSFGNVQHHQRLLTGVTFLSAKPDEDAAVARQWGTAAGKIHQTVEGELTAIKSLYVPRARLDNEFDTRTLGAVFFEDVWLQALRFVKVPVISAGSFGRAIERREESRAALIKAFRARYANASGTVAVRVVRLEDGKPGKGIGNADVSLKGGGSEVRMAHKGDGLYSASGLRPGSYTVTVSAEGFKARDGGVVAKASVELPAPDDTTRVGEATVLMIYATSGTELSVSIEVSPSDGRIASSGANSAANLKANVVARPDSGKLRFQWAVGDKVLDQGDGKRTTTFRGEGYGGRDVTVSVVVIDEKGREGTASVVVAVSPAEDIPVVLAPHRGEIGRNEDETIEVSAPIGDDVKYQWTISEDGGHPRPWDGIRKYLVNGANHAGKQLTLTVRATTGDGRTGSATTSLQVKDEDVEKKDEDAAKPEEPTKQPPKRGAGGSVSGMFPGEPFNGMQISYSASGCSFPTMKDEPGFGTYRNYEGRLGNGTMTVSGTARMGGGFGADLVVSVTAGGKTAEHKAYIKSGWPGFNNESFNLSVPIPDDATSGGFSIMMDGHYSMGGGWRGLGVTGSCSADGPEGEAPRGTEELAVDLNDQKDPVPLGQKVELTARTKGGRFPYEYAWTGVEGKDDKATFSSKKPGDFTVAVKVSDTDGKSASDTTQIKVAPLKFELAGVPARPVYGSSAKLTARAVGPAPQDAKFRYLWQASEQGIELAPPESDSGETTVTFGRPGNVKLWAQVVDAETGTTIGETPQVATTVVAPAFTIRFTPPAGQGRIGQEVKAQITANPEVPAKLIDYRWLEPATSNRREATDNASEIGFVPKDAKPVVLKALARVPSYGDELGTVEASYTGAPYKVQVTVEERGPKPLTWDPAKGGLVPVPKGTYAADEQVGLRAALEGEPKPAEVRWRWTVNDGTTIGNPISQTPAVSRHEPGAISATVEALDRDGNVLGSGTTSLSVTVSADAVGNAKAKAEAAKLVAQAKAAWARKDPAGALALIEKAQKLDPNDPEIGRLAKEYRDGKARFDRAAALREEGGRLQGEKKLKEALDRYKEAQALWPDPKLADHIAKVEAALKERQTVIDQAEALRRNPQSIGCGKGLGEATALADRLQKVDPGKAAVLRKDIATVATATASGLVGNQLDFAKGVPCLEVAQKLDPANAQIGQELERARQIQAGWRELQALPPRMDAAAAAGRILEADQIRSRAAELARGIDQVPPVRDLLASLIAKWNRAMEVYRAHRDSLMAELQAMLDGRRYQESIARGDAELAREWYPGDAQRIREFQSHAREKMAYEASQKTPQSPTTPGATPGGTAPPAAPGRGPIAGEATGGTASPGTRTPAGPAGGPATVTSVPPGSAGPGTASAGGASQGGAGSIRIEACIDGSDWLRIENGRLVHEHRGFAQIGAHPDCPASHAVGGGGLLVNGQRVSLGQLPYGVGIASLGGFELEQGRGSARLDGPKGLLLDDDGAGGPSVYVVRLYGGASATTPAATPPKPPAPKQVRTGNVGGVTNGPTAPTTFTFEGPVRLLWLQTYHWNHARGATPGRIGLRHQDGTVYGPWPTRGLPGQGGVPNAYWRADPGVVLKPGTYTVTDSNPSTWATNAEAGNKGFADLEVVPVTDAAATTPPASVAAPAPADAATPATPPTAAAPASATILTGRWEASCDGNDEVYPVTMRQDGSRLRVVVEGQAEYEGTFNGQRLEGTSADGLDNFDGTAVSPTELRLDWEGRTSADSSHVYHNSCTLRRKGAPPAEAVPARPTAPPAATTGPPATSATPPPKASATAPKGGTVPCKRDGRNPFEEDQCIEIEHSVPTAPR